MHYGSRAYWFLVKVGVSQDKGYLFGVPIIRIVIFWGLYGDP